MQWAHIGVLLVLVSRRLNVQFSLLYCRLVFVCQSGLVGALLQVMLLALPCSIFKLFDDLASLLGVEIIRFGLRVKLLNRRFFTVDLLGRILPWRLIRHSKLSGVE